MAALNQLGLRPPLPAPSPLLTPCEVALTRSPFPSGGNEISAREAPCLRAVEGAPSWANPTSSPAPHVVSAGQATRIRANR